MTVDQKLTDAESVWLKRLEDKGRELNYRWTTVQAYRGHTLRYMRWLTRNKATVADWTRERRVGMYLRKLAIRDRVGPVTRKQAFYSLLFFYQRVLGHTLGDIDKLPLPKIDKRLPAILDEEQALAVIAQIEDSPWTPFRLMALLLYGCGLRTAELYSLRHKDVNIRHSLLTLHGTKGRADRRIGLPCCLSIPMQRQLERVELQWQEDRERGLPVSMPGLDGQRRKDPNLPFALGWQYVFSQRTPCPNPQAWPGEEKILYRHHLYPNALQRVVRRAAIRCNLDGVLTPHVFRHIFASQLGWNGEHLTTIQRVLGHKNIETTMIYVHEKKHDPHSPLDAAVERRASQPALPAPRTPLALPFAVA